MLTRTAFGLALILAAASGALAATKPHAPAPAAAPVQNVYSSSSGSYVGTDPDASIRFELNRDATHGRY
jgi:hypothetical protein